MDVKVIIRARRIGVDEPPKNGIWDVWEFVDFGTATKFDVEVLTIIASGGDGGGIERDHTHTLLSGMFPRAQKDGH